MKKMIYPFTFLLTIQLLFTVNVNGQKLKDLLNKVKKGIENVGNAPGKLLTGSTTGKMNSEIKTKDLFQSKTIPEYDTNKTRIKIAKNLMIDIRGKYPKGYVPKWRFISYKSQLDFQVENWVVESSGTQSDQREFSIGDYNGKALVRFGAFIGCDCFADIIIKDSMALISDIPQTFLVTKFRKIVNERSTGEPCGGSSNTYTGGGWEGKVTLVANDNGDITMDLVIENFSVGYQPSFQKEYLPSKVSYRFLAKGITVENEMSAEKANDIVNAEIEAKQRQKDYIAKTTKQGDSLQKVIAKKYPQKDCSDCFSKNSNSNVKVTPTTTVYTNGYGDVVGTSSGSDWDINTKTEISNKCGYGLLFIGIQQLYEEKRGYYLIPVTKIMPANYSYSSEQGLMGSVFTSLIGGGSEFNFKVQDKFYPNSSYVGGTQWIKVIKK